MTEEKETSTPDYEEEEYENGLLKWMSIAVVVLTVGGFVALAWYAYRSGTESVSPEEVPLIEATNGDMKEAPEDPGGMQFPNQDKTIYDAMSGSAPKPAAERILPAPEEPVDVAPDAAEPEVAETWVNEKLYDKKTDPKAAPKAEPKPEPEPEPVVEAKPEPKAEEAPVAEKPVAEAKPAPAPAPKASSGSVRVQLASLKSEAEASATWKKVSAAHGDLLEGKGHTIARADLDTGTYYRVQVTGLKDRDQAVALCEALKSRGQACIVAK